MKFALVDDLGLKSLLKFVVALETPSRHISIEKRRA
jgi:hypothetical protein